MWWQQWSLHLWNTWGKNRCWDCYHWTICRNVSKQISMFNVWKEIYHSFLIVHLTWKFVLETLLDIKLTGAGSFLSSLSNIPSDLLDFYTDFGFHVRRGFQTLQRNLQSNGFIRYMVDWWIHSGILFLHWWNDNWRIFSVI